MRSSAKIRSLSFVGCFILFIQECLSVFFLGLIHLVLVIFFNYKISDLQIFSWEEVGLLAAIYFCLRICIPNRLIAGALVGVNYIVFCSYSLIKFQFLNEPLYPADLKLIPELYHFISFFQFLALCLPLVITLSFTLFLIAKINLKQSAKRVLVCTLIFTALFKTGLLKPLENLYDKKSQARDWFSRKERYLKHGFLFNFVSNEIQVLAGQRFVPNEESVFSALKNIKLFPFTKKIITQKPNLKSLPNIYVILVESLWDPQVIPARNDISHDFPVKKLPDIFDHRFRNLLISNGSLYAIAPYSGGGTSNSEFEVLCGFPDLYRNGSIWSLVLDPKFPCLPNQLRAEGYQTNAFDAYLPNFYNHEKAFSAIGFDNYFHRENLFANLPGKDGLIDDQFFFKAVENKVFSTGKTKHPQFNYILTDGTHSPYPFSHPHSIFLGAKSEELLKYSNSILHSTKAIAGFINRIVSQDPSAIIYLSGDHSPPLGSNYSGYREAFNLPKNPSAGPSNAEQWALLRVPIFIRNFGKQKLSHQDIELWKIPNMILSEIKTSTRQLNFDPNNPPDFFKNYSISLRYRLMKNIKNGAFTECNIDSPPCRKLAKFKEAYEKLLYDQIHGERFADRYREE